MSVSDVRWVHYEAIQSDIFDHLLSSLPIFGLRAFQFPTDASFSGGTLRIQNEIINLHACAFVLFFSFRV